MKKKPLYKWNVPFKIKKVSFKKILKAIDKLSKEEARIEMIIAKETIKLLKREKPYDK